MFFDKESHAAGVASMQLQIERNMIAKNLEDNFIVETTGLTLEEIAHLKANEYK